MFRCFVIRINELTGILDFGSFEMRLIQSAELLKRECSTVTVINIYIFYCSGFFPFFFSLSF